MPAGVGATTWIVPEPEEMLDTADAVVLATVRGLRSVAAPDGSGITTEVTLDVHEGYKGAVAGDRLVLHEIGGEVAGQQQWIGGSPEYEVGEVVLAYVKQDSRSGRLSTQHLGIGRVGAEIGRDGRVWLNRIRGRGVGTERETLGRFVRGLPRNLARAPRVQGAARLEGVTATPSAFRLMAPESRWFDSPVPIFGSLVGDTKLGLAASNQAVRDAAAAWSGQPGSELEVGYAGERAPVGFRCGTPDVSVSFNDPLDQVDDPSGCGGVLAVGGFCASGSAYGGTPYRRITSAAIVMNNGWGGCSFWNQKNVTEVLTHELGHALGFAHSSDTQTTDSFLHSATMYWIAHFDGRGGSLRDYDRGAVAFLYDDGTGSGPTPTPTPAPTPNPNDTELAADVTLVHRSRVDLTRLSLKVAFELPYDPRSGGDLSFELTGAESSYGIEVPAASFQTSDDGNRARLVSEDLNVSIRRRDGVTTVVVDLTAEDPALVGLIGNAELAVGLTLPTASLAVQSECTTRSFLRREKMRCLTEP